MITTKEFLDENCTYNYITGYYELVDEENLIEFAKFHVEAALKEATGEAPLHCAEGIRNCYPLDNIK